MNDDVETKTASGLPQENASAPHGETVVRSTSAETETAPSPDPASTVVQSEVQASRAGHESSSARPSPVVPGFELLDELGRGAMGVVFRARQVGLNRTVALKMVLAGPYADPSTRARFLIEAEVVAALEHTHIVRVFAFGEHDSHPYLAMEYLPGGSLAEQLKSRGAFPPREAAELVAKLASAIGHAHARGVVHRDIKPGNVMLTADGEPRLTDFGLAKVERSDLTGTGSVMGTPAYMAPEQAAGKVKEIGPPADVYALGAVLYDLLTGRPPFRGDSVAATLHQVLYADPQRLRTVNPSIPRDLDTICLKCLEKDPAKRYPSAVELAEDLRRFLAGEAVRARRAAFIERTWHWTRRHRVEVGVTALVVFLAVALVIVASRPKETVVAPLPPEQPPAQPAGDDLLATVEGLDRTHPGWRIEQMEKARRTIPPTENSAVVIDRVVVVLPPDFDKQLTHFMTANAKAPPTVPLPEEFRTARSGPALLKARLAAGMLSDRPYGRFPIDWNRDVITTLLPHAQRPRQVAALLEWNAVSLASSGQFDHAILDCRGSLNAGRALHDEPVAISQLVRIACGHICIQSLGRVLALGSASDKELVAMSEALRLEEQAAIFTIIARAERAMMHRLFTVAGAGDIVTPPAGLAPDEADMFQRLPKGAAARVSHVWALKAMTRLVEISQRPPHEQPTLLKEWDATIRRDAPEGARLALPAGEKIGQATLRYTAMVRSAITAIAIERYRLSTNRWPNQFTDLVPDYLPAIPTDPHDGAPLRYRRLADGVVVYGIGPDGKDDSGGITSVANDRPPADFGTRLWDVELRGKGEVPR